jgi:hypothetical protein
MKKLLRFSALLTAALMVFIMVGCGGEDEEEGDTTPPTMTSATPPSGAELAANASITLIFSEKMGAVTVAGGVVTLGDGKTVTVAPAGEWSAGSVTLTVTGTDVAGNDLAAQTLSYTVKAADNTPPDIDDAKCDPKNGADGLEPGDVTAIKIVFTETMKGVKVDGFEPEDAKVDPQFDGDKTLNIAFLGGYSLGNEMEIVVKLSGTDLAGNALATTEYKFATMAKEE